VNISAVIRGLKSRNYDGWLVIEQDTTNVDPTSTARENRLYLENVLKVESESRTTLKSFTVKVGRAAAPRNVRSEEKL
jgi:hypothetical protein